MKLDDLLADAALPQPEVDLDGALADVARRGQRRRHLVATTLVASVITVVATSAAVAWSVSRSDSDRVLATADDPSATDGSEQTTPSDPPRIWRHDEASPGGHDAIVRGWVTYDPELDCLFLLGDDGTRHPVIWPYGTEASADGPGVVLPGGQLARVGDLVEGSGGYGPGASFDIPDDCYQPDGDAAQFNSMDQIRVTPPSLPHVARHSEPGEPGGEQALVEGTLAYLSDSGCFVLTSDDGQQQTHIVWPYGTEPTAEAGPGVVLPDGQTFSLGDWVGGAGGFHDLRTESGYDLDVPEPCLPPPGDTVFVFQPQGTLLDEPSAP